MKPKSIGIIGGAGPLAGVFLLERIVSLSNKTYGCCKDSDFPKIILLSFPFSEMLTPQFDPAKLQIELKACLQQLRNNGASVLAIACNTLHAFLDKEDDLNDLVHLPRSVATTIPDSEKPLIFCTSTSSRFGLHQQFFDCCYPDSETQREIDCVINQILKGVNNEIILEELRRLIRAQDAQQIVLGCTELSLFSSQLALPNKLIIDPLEVVAKKILEKVFI